MMKNLMLIILMIFSLTTLKGQVCSTGNINFSTQAEIDEFSTKYPNCNEIDGDISFGNCNWPFGESNDITNLNGLTQITKINGSLSICGCKNLTDITGLKNLKILTGDLSIKNNKSLKNLYGLEGLSQIEGDLEVFASTSGFTLQGLNNIKVIRGDLDLNSGFLKSINGLNSLDSIFGGMYINRTKLKDLKSFSGIKYIKKSIGIYRTELNNLNGLQGLKYINGLSLHHNSSLNSLYGLEGVNLINGDFSLSENGKLGNLSGLKNLKLIKGNLTISWNKTAGLYGLIEIQGNLKIDHAGSFKSSDFGRLKKIDGNFIYSQNHLAKVFNGINSLEVIGGTLEIKDNNDLDDIGSFNNLDSVGGVLIASHYELKNFTGLNHLKYIRGDFKIRNEDKLINIKGLKNLKVIKGNYSISSNGSLINIEFPPLVEYLGGIYISYNKKIKEFIVPLNITKLHKDLVIYNNEKLDKISIPTDMKTISGDFQIKYNSNLKSIADFNKLEIVHGDFEFDSYTLVPFINLDSVYGDFTIDLHHNEKLGLNKIRYLGGSIDISNVKNLKNLSMLSKLYSIKGSLQLSFLNELQSFEGLDSVNFIDGRFYLFALDSMVNFKNLANLSRINGSLSIYNCDNLKSLDGLQNLKSIDGYLRLIKNKSLSDISSLSDINPKSIHSKWRGGTSLEIKDNHTLSNCAIDIICNLIYDDDKRTLISNNAEGCSDKSQLNCSHYGISGVVFFDSNQNKIKDNNEMGVPQTQLLILPDSVKKITSQRGKYLHICEEGENYTIKYLKNENWILTTDSVSYSKTFQYLDTTNRTNNFGVYPLFDTLDFDINLSSNPTRCNSEVDFFIRCQNNSTSAIKTILKLKIDSNTIFKKSYPYVSYNKGKYFWKLDTLYPFQYQNINITLKMPSQEYANEKLNFLLEIYKDSMGVEVFIEDYKYTPIVLCSFDPNDKLVMPSGDEEYNYTFKDSSLVYTVRFQNTGNAPAIDVQVIDTIDTMLDINSLKVINSSAPVKTSLKDRTINFLFKDIWLPDSLSNEPKSHGFVTYSINPIDSLEDFSVIKNTASIIFDLNKPIITNTTINTLIDSFCTDKIILFDTTICKGESYLGHFESSEFELIYPINILCDSIVSINLEVKEPDSSIQYLTICKGEEISLNNTSYIGDTAFTIRDTLFNTNKCGTYTDYYIDILEMDSTKLDTLVCKGDRLLLGNNYIQCDSNITFRDTLYQNNKCGTIIDYEINIIDLETVNKDTIVCKGENITLGDSIFYCDSPMIFQDTSYISGQCKTIFNYQVNIIELDSFVIDTTICEGENFHMIDSTSVFYFKDKNQDTGCADYYTVYLTVLPADDPACSTSVINLEQNSFIVWPNPTTGFLNISSIDESVFQYILYDTYGRILIFGNEKSINLRDMPKGIYYLKVINNKSQNIFKIYHSK